MEEYKEIVKVKIEENKLFSLDIMWTPKIKHQRLSICEQLKPKPMLRHLLNELAPWFTQVLVDQ